MLEAESESLDSDMSVGNCSQLTFEVIGLPPPGSPFDSIRFRAVGLAGSFLWGSLIVAEAAANWSSFGEADDNDLFLEEDDEGRLPFEDWDFDDLLAATCSSFDFFEDD